MITAPPRPTVATAAWNKWRAPLLLSGAVALAAGAIVVAGHVDPYSGVLPPCPIKAATGLSCPGCGITRGLHALAGGDLGAAARHNVLLVAGLAVLVLWWATSLWSSRDHARSSPTLPDHQVQALEGAPPAWTRRRVPVPTWVPLGLGLMVVFTIARNLPPLQPYLAG